MSKLINELKSEHQTLVAILEEAKALGISNKEGQAKLNSAKMGLLAHLKKEDNQLYPKLKDEAAKNANVKMLLEVMAKDMDKVSGSAMSFFDKYANGGKGMEFARDYGQLIAALGARMRTEETSLYAEFENLKID